jgi:fructokinase
MPLLGRRDVFFFDRLTESSVRLAEEARANGALTVFEPSAAGESRLFDRALRASQIVKYSAERMSPLMTRSLQTGFIEIQTLGAEGLRFRMRSLDPTWVTLPAIRAGRVVDTAGAGDWCTSGFLHLMSRYAPNGALSDLGYNHVYCALRTGQVVAALNCAHAGARGLMRSLHSQRLRALLVAVSERLASECGQAPSHLELEQLLGDELEVAQTAGDPVTPRATTLCCGLLSEVSGLQAPDAILRLH